MAQVDIPEAYQTIKTKLEAIVARKYYTKTENDNQLAAKQDALVSGTNIKTVNNNSLLGSGNIDISASGTVDSSLSSTSTNPVQNKVIDSALSGKAPTNHRSTGTSYGQGDATYYGHVKVDSSLSSSSSNPVQNKLVTNIVKYKITASNYNPTIGSDITITVTAYNQAGGTVANHACTLTLPDDSTTSLTTNSNGVATYTYSCNTFGIRRFSIETYVAFINVTGWKRVHNSGGVQVYINEELRLCNVSFSVAKTMSANTSNTIASGLPSAYSPPHAINQNIRKDGECWINGTVISYYTSVALNNYTVRGEFIYRY